MAVADPPRRRVRSVARVVGAVVLVCTAVLTIIRLTGLDDGTVLALVVVGVPVAAVVGVVVAGVLAVVRAWWSAGLAVGLVVVQLVVLAPRFVADEVAPEGTARVRVATINSHVGQVDPKALVEFARSERVDVLAVEELPPGAVEGLDDAGLRELMPYRELRPWDDSSLYSRTPLTGGGPLDAATTWPQTTATVAVGGKPVRVVAVHTYYPAGDVDLWTRDLAALRSVAGEDVVVLGDFNATLDHASMRDLLAAGLVDTHAEVGRGWAPTWPSALPVVQLDHVLHGHGLVGVSATERTLPGSDHRLVFAELALR
ncbi:endonuclease/exonuclease/phosphatase family protein [Umezawaea tangerina]|uniref:Endonuclease/exonuclease/phosphatase family metal-dependent hydrolase n=1 Tax=Umezawaea tangerina TaxID=84725 RepID=A0A2T0SPD3_9PSEU|nr:endonuclease/exonuclease/phosphatase family protein [Umezawaea tangerina]PRY35268.1 endonuclease/exonuclease/phosphatase family metal-dependent hydrolase [Umezawaea tangerina]